MLTACAFVQLISHMTEQKRQMASDVAYLSKICATYKQHLRTCQTTLNKQNHRLQALYEMAQVRNRVKSVVWKR